MEDSKKSFVRLKNTEKKLVSVKSAAWAGVGLGAIGTGIGAFALWLMRDRGWF